jgi:hypothetical protein
MNALFSAGTIVFAYVIGAWAIRGALAPKLRRSALAHHALTLVFGIALLTPPLVLLATEGIFRTSWIGALGWIGSAIGFAFRRSRRPGRLRLDVTDLAMVVVTMAFVGIAALGRDETLGAGRDQQVYAEAAVALSERGRLSALFIHLDVADLALLRSATGILAHGAGEGGNGVDQPIKLIHPIGWPVWLAIVHSMFGIDGLYVANAFIFALGSLLLFRLLRIVANPAIAIATAILFLALPSSLWIAGISLSEPLAMTLLLAVPLLASSGMNRSRLLIAVVLLAAMLVRIDSALAALGTIAAALLVGVASPICERLSAAKLFSATQLVALLVAALSYVVMYVPYIQHISEYLAVAMVGAIALALMIFALTPANAAFLRGLLNSCPLRVAAIATLLTLFLYSVAFRPTLASFSVIGGGTTGSRDFREDSVLNFATYLSWPILLAALGGVCYSIWRHWAGGRGFLNAILLTLGLGPTLVFLWFPLVSPDHPWAFRRFVPISVPFALLFAGVSTHLLTRKIPRVGSTVGAVTVLAPYALLLSRYPMDRQLLRENDGMTNQLAAIAGEMPDTLIVSDGTQSNVAAALLFAYGKQVVTIDPNFPYTHNVEPLTEWIKAKAKIGHPAWLIHGAEVLPGTKISAQREWSLTTKYLVPSVRPPATQVAVQKSQVILSRVDGFDSSYVTSMFGGERVWGVSEGGFFAPEVAAFGQFRYTNGAAWIDVPGDALRNANAIKVDVFSYARVGERRWFRLLIDDQPAWMGTVDPGVNTLRIPVTTLKTGNVVRLTFVSEAVDPVEMSANDLRVGLSIGLVGIRMLRAGEPWANGPTMEGFRSELALVNATSAAFSLSLQGETNIVLDVRNAGTAFWPSVRELGGPVGAVQIALRWYAHGKSDSFVGDNRWALSISMLAGDRARLRVPLKPIGLDGKTLPPGEYDIRLGMVRETVGLFADNGDAVLSIPVTVAP